MSRNEIARSPEIIAVEINGIKAQAGAVMASAFSFARRSVFEIGKRLEEAKSLLPHGEWGKWLAENVAYSESTAGNIMRCYREFGDEQIDMLSGISDAEFFGSLSQSQMVELFALPKPERRAFVEEHREELDSGEMSVRELKEEIKRLKEENDSRDEELKALKSAPAPEPVVQEVIVNQPSESQIDAIRGQITEQLRAEFDEERKAVHDEYEEKIRSLEEARDEAEKDADNAEKLEEQLKSEAARHKAEMEKLKADHEEKMAAAEAEHQKKMRTAAAGSDADVVRVQIALSAIQRETRSITAILAEIISRGETAKADKLRAQIETKIGLIISDAGWTV